MSNEQKQDDSAIWFLGVECRMDDSAGVFTGRSAGNVYQVRTSATGRVDATVKFGDVWTGAWNGQSVMEVEKLAKKAIISLQQMIAIAGIVASAPKTVADVMLQFLTRWAHIPPLVRASYAEQQAMEARRSLGRNKENAFFLNGMHTLPRRAMVREWFGQANLASIDLFLALAAQADAEAMSRGIDADTAGVLTGPYDPKKVTKEQMEGTLEAVVLQSAAKEVEKEMDQQLRLHHVEQFGGQEERKKLFRNELRDLVNRFSKENGSNTPDDVLADMLVGVLDTYDKAVTERDRRATAP